MPGWLNDLIALDFDKKLEYAGSVLAAVGTGAFGFVKFYAPYKKAGKLADEAYKLLNTGLCIEALQKFDQAFKLSSWNKKAELGLKKARILNGMENLAFDLEVKDLYEHNREDAHANWLMGIVHAHSPDFYKALPYYKKAVKLNPELAEAHFGLGVLYDKLHGAKKALPAYQKAVQLFASPKYLSNLAYCYLKLGQLDQAIATYERNEYFPLSKIEAAKIYWIKHELEKAKDRLKEALLWLGEDTLMNKPENKDPWYFNDRSLVYLDDKIAYANLCYLFSLFLLNDPGFDGKPMLYDENIKAIFQADLAELAQFKPDWAEKIEAFEEKYLSAKLPKTGFHVEHGNHACHPSTSSQETAP